MVRRLVATPGCNVSLVDSQGSTPIHYAASLQEPQCLDALLTQPINGARSAVTQALGAFNYQGESAGRSEHEIVATMLHYVDSAAFAGHFPLYGDLFLSFIKLFFLISKK